jgi:hypothetical protein
MMRSCHGHDRMVVGFTTTSAISVQINIVSTETLTNGRIVPPGTNDRPTYSCRNVDIKLQRL